MSKAFGGGFPMEISPGDAEVRTLHRAANILLVDDDTAAIGALGKILADFGQLRFATSGADALRLARESTPDLVLLDIEMPGMNGLEVCAAMKQDARLRDVPVIFVTSHTAVEQEVAGLTLGAVDFISKPPSAPVVAARVRTHLRLKEMSDALRHAATTDALTGIANRRYFDETLAREWARAHRTHKPLSLLLIDIDCFKAYNDRYGHQGGDTCLALVASAIRACAFRPGDLAARYGGEEFTLLLPDSAETDARQVAMRLLAAVGALALPHATSPVADHVTLSVGMSVYDPNRHRAEASPVTLISAADQALYAAKRAGRNRARFLDLQDNGNADKAIAVSSGALGRLPTPIAAGSIRA